MVIYTENREVSKSIQCEIDEWGILMKKLFCVLLSVLFIFSFLGCNNSQNINKNNKEINSKDSMENNENKSDINNIKEEKIVVSQIKMNEPFEIKTEDGSYKVTIKSVTNTEWQKEYYEKDNQKIILLNLECENIDFSNEENDGVVLYNSFLVKDKENMPLTRSQFNYDRAENGTNVIPKNSKCEISMPYVVEKDIMSINIEFNRGGELNNIPITE